MECSAWLRCIAVLVLIGCCSCKVVLITDHRNGMREKGRQKEVSSKQSQSKAWMPGLRSRADISELGLIGRGKNGQIFGTILSGTSDGPSAPQQSIENFIDSFSTLFRSTPLQQSGVSNTRGNAVFGDELDLRQGEITSSGSGASNAVSTADSVGMTGAIPGRGRFSAFAPDMIDDTPVRIAGTFPSRGLSQVANTMSSTNGFDDTMSATALLEQGDGFSDDSSLFDINQGQDIGGLVTIGGNEGTFFSNQGPRMTSAISSGQNRPTLRTGEDMRFSQAQAFGDMTDQRDSSSGMRDSSIDDINSLFNSRIEGSTGSVSEQTGGVVSEDLGVGLSARSQDRLTQLSTFRTGDTNVGSMTASSLGSNLISNLLSRIFSTPSQDNDESLTEIGNALDSMDTSETDVGGAQLLTRPVNNGIMDNAQITTGGQRGETAGFTGFEDVNTDGLVGAKNTRTFPRRKESRKMQNDRGKSNMGKRFNNQLTRTQDIDDENKGFDENTKRVQQSDIQHPARKLSGKPLARGSRIDSRKGSTMVSPSKTRPSSKDTSDTTNSQKQQITGRRPESDKIDSRNVDSTITQFKSRGPYMVFQTSKTSNAKPDGLINFASPGIPSTAFIPSNANKSFRRVRPSFSRALSRNNKASGSPVGSTVAQTPTLAIASQSRTGEAGSGNTFRVSGVSGSNPSFSPQSGISSNSLRRNQGNTASVSSATFSPRTGNAQISNRGGAAGTSRLLGVDGRPSVPVRVFMILPNSASGSSTGASGGTFNPSAIGNPRMKQTTRFKSNLDTPFAMPSVSMGSTTNLGGSGLPDRGSLRPSGRSFSTSIGRGGSIRNTGSFSRRLPIGGNGRIGNNFGPGRVISGVQKGMLQRRFNTSSGRNTGGITSQVVPSRSGMPSTKQTVKNRGSY